MSEENGVQVNSLGSRFILAALLVALLGYFFDVECMVNRCETAASTSHGECVSPVVIPDSHQPAQVALEFILIPVLLDLVAACQPAEEVADVAKTFWPLRPPPEHLLSLTAHSRRGPPTRA